MYTYKLYYRVIDFHDKITVRDVHSIIFVLVSNVLLTVWKNFWILPYFAKMLTKAHILQNFGTLYETMYFMEKGVNRKMIKILFIGHGNI